MFFNNHVSTIVSPWYNYHQMFSTYLTCDLHTHIYIYIYIYIYMNVTGKQISIHTQSVKLTYYLQLMIPHIVIQMLSMHYLHK